MMDALDRQSESLRDLDAVLTRVEAKIDVLPSRTFIAGALVRAMVVTTAAMALAGMAVTGGVALSMAR